MHYSLPVVLSLFAFSNAQGFLSSCTNLYIASTNFEFSGTLNATCLNNNKVSVPASIDLNKCLGTDGDGLFVWKKNGNFRTQHLGCGLCYLQIVDGQEEMCCNCTDFNHGGAWSYTCVALNERITSTNGVLSCNV